MSLSQLLIHIILSDPYLSMLCISFWKISDIPLLTSWILHHLKDLQLIDIILAVVSVERNFGGSEGC